MNLSNKDIYLQYALSQFLPFGEVRRGSSFNAYNCMKAYSYNGERYGYYGYDASGERTYKYDIFSAGSWTNQTGGMDVSLQIDKMMLYPNGYLNMNQNGEYTKHYYADALRIASKIGSGFSQDLCYEANQIGNEVDPDYLDVRMNKQHDEMMEELTELINGNQITSINPIPYPEADLCNLSGSGIETALFFYHPDHLGSTGMVTNNSSNITQGMLYAPFGEIICDYNPTFHDSPMPNYAFNAKELDEENNMYYYSARYYAPPTFISRDPMFEKYPSISPYTYCANNPVGFVDPTGETHYQANENGQITPMKDKDGNILGKDDKFDMLYGKKGADPIKINDQKILSSLSETGANSNYTLSTAEGGENSQNDMLKTFKFLADNTDVEWRVDRFKEGGKTGYSIGTLHNSSLSPSAEKMGHSGSSVIAFIHSHPNTAYENEKSSMGTKTSMGYGNRYTITGDMSVKHSYYPNSFYYMYSPNSGNLWEVRNQGQEPRFIKTVNSYKGFFFGTMNTR
jgi:RHS repeat-associated protein